MFNFLFFQMTEKYTTSSTDIKQTVDDHYGIRVKGFVLFCLPFQFIDTIDKQTVSKARGTTSISFTNLAQMVSSFCVGFHYPRSPDLRLSNAS